MFFKLLEAANLTFLSAVAHVLPFDWLLTRRSMPCCLLRCGGLRTSCYLGTSCCRRAASAAMIACAMIGLAWHVTALAMIGHACRLVYS
jgi:hypothetical protein